MSNGADISKSGVEIALSKSILQYHILNTNPVYWSNNKHTNRVKEKKTFHKKRKKEKEKEKHQIYEDKNWTSGLVGGNSKYFH